MFHNLICPSPTNGHLFGTQVLATKNNSASNIFMYMFLHTGTFIPMEQSL